MSFPRLARRLLGNWALILLFWTGIGYWRYHVRWQWAQQQTWKSATATVTQTLPARGSDIVEYTYNGIKDRYYTWNLPPVGSTFTVEYVEAEPTLHRREGEELELARVMQLKWVVALALAASAHLMGYFFFFMDRFF